MEKNGKLWDTTQADLGLLMRRIHLPEDEKEHMPPTGKPQLTDEEIAIIENWIKSGSDIRKKVADLPPTDTLRILAYKKLKSFELPYDFAAADEFKISQLSNSNRVIYSVAVGSPAVVVNFYNAANYSSQQVQELSALREQVVELNLSKMPVKDEDLKAISEFPHLKTLNLNYTSITGKTLGDLKKMPQLESLSLAGTAVNRQQLETLQGFPKLKTVYVWNTPANAINGLAYQKGRVKFETGFKGDTMTLKLTPPVIDNETEVFTQPEPILLKHYVKGVTIRYTTDGTDPDSSSSPVYTHDLVVDRGFFLKARAVKEGWFSSDIISQYFFTSRYRPDSVELLKPVDEKYRADGARTLVDLQKSDMSAGSGKWLGFRNNNLEAMLFFTKPVQLHSVTLSMLKDLNAYIFPPTEVEIWGSDTGGKMKLLAHVSPRRPVKGEANEIIPVDCSFAPREVSQLKVVAKPLDKLPVWHSGKGEKAWIFIDEILCN